MRVFNIPESVATWSMSAGRIPSPRRKKCPEVMARETHRILWRIWQQVVLYQPCRYMHICVLRNINTECAFHVYITMLRSPRVFRAVSLTVYIMDALVKLLFKIVYLFMCTQEHTHTRTNTQTIKRFFNSIGNISTYQGGFPVSSSNTVQPTLLKKSTVAFSLNDYLNYPLA